MSSPPHATSTWTEIGLWAEIKQSKINISLVTAIRFPCNNVPTFVSKVIGPLLPLKGRHSRTFAMLGGGV